MPNAEPRYAIALLFAVPLLLVAAAGPAAAQTPDALKDATWRYSGDGGKTFALAKPAQGCMHAQATFTVADPAAQGGLQFVPGKSLWI